MERLTPHSRPGRLALIDGRTAQAQFMKRIKNDLTRHVGGQPSVTQRMAIDQCAMLSLRLHMMDRAELQDRSAKNTHEYATLTSALSALLQQLSEPVPQVAA